MPTSIADLAGFILAFVDLIILYAAFRLLGPFMVAMASHVPLIGGTLARAVNAIIDDTVAGADPYLDPEVRGVIGAILGPVYWVEHVMAGMLNASNDAAAGIEMITGPLSQGWINNALSIARAWVIQAEDFAQAAVNALSSTLAADLIAVYSTIAATEGALELYIEGEIAAETAFIEAEIVATDAFIEAEIVGVDAFIEAEIVGVDAFIEAEIAAETAFIEAEIVATDAVIEAEDIAITAYATALAAGLQVEISLVEATLTEFVTQEFTILQDEIDALENDCLTDLCNSTKDWSKLIQDLAGAGGLAGLLALAAQFAADPNGTARRVEGDFSQAAADAAGFIKSLIGLA